MTENFSEIIKTLHTIKEGQPYKEYPSNLLSVLKELKALNINEEIENQIEVIEKVEILWKIGGSKILASHLEHLLSLLTSKKTKETKSKEEDKDKEKKMESVTNEEIELFIMTNKKKKKSKKKKKNSRVKLPKYIPLSKEDILNKTKPFLDKETYCLYMSLLKYVTYYSKEKIETIFELNIVSYIKEQHNFIYRKMDKEKDIEELKNLMSQQFRLFDLKQRILFSSHNKLFSLFSSQNKLISSQNRRIEKLEEEVITLKNKVHNYKTVVDSIRLRKVMKLFIQLLLSKYQVYIWKKGNNYYFNSDIKGIVVDELNRILNGLYSNKDKFNKISHLIEKPKKLHFNDYDEPTEPISMEEVSEAVNINGFVEIINKLCEDNEINEVLSFKRKEIKMETFYKSLFIRTHN